MGRKDGWAHGQRHALPPFMHEWDTREAALSPQVPCPVHASPRKGGAPGDSLLLRLPLPASLHHAMGRGQHSSPHTLHLLHHLPPQRRPKPLLVLCSSHPVAKLPAGLCCTVAMEELRVASLLPCRREFCIQYGPFFTTYK